MLGRRLIAEVLGEGAATVVLDGAQLHRGYFDGLAELPARLTWQGSEVSAPWRVVDLDSGELVASGPAVDLARRPQGAAEPPYVATPGFALAVRLRPA